MRHASHVRDQTGRTFCLRGDRLVDADPDLVADVIVRVEKELMRQKQEPIEPYQQLIANQRTYGELVDLLLPLARGSVAIFKIDESSSWRRADHVTLQLTHKLKRYIASMHRIVVDQGFEFVAGQVDADKLSWQVRYTYDPDMWLRVASTLCVSADHVWVRGQDEDRLFETERLPISEIAPVESLRYRVHEMPTTLPCRHYRRYSEQLEALRRAERMCDEFTQAAAAIEPRSRDDLARIAKLGFLDPSEYAMLRRSTRLYDRLLDRADNWYEEIEVEQARLCQEIFGIRRGDVLIGTNYRGKLVKLRADHVRMFEYGGELHIQAQGPQYRKDGLLGKREGHLSVELELDE